MESYRKGPMARALVSLLLLCSTIAVAEAGAPTEQIRETLDALATVFTNQAWSSPDHAQERREKIQQVLSQRFAYEAMAKRSLGRHWDELTPDQQKAFIPLFRPLLEQMHTQRIERLGDKDRRVVFKDESMHADGSASVNIEIVDPHDPTVNEDIEYRLQKHQDVWMVHDLVMDGGSIITNFRTQFDRVIRQESYDELVKRLKQSSASVEKGR